MEIQLAAGSAGLDAPVVRVLGRFQVEIDGGVVELPKQVQRLVGYLAVAGTREPRDRLAGRLWPFSTQRRADANLRTALWRVGGADSRLICASRTALSIADGVHVDARVACSRAHALISGAVDVPAPPDERLWIDDLLPGWDEDWLVIERERMRQLRIHGLEALSRRLVQAGRFAHAIDAALCAIAAEPLRESAHRALIEAHLAEGNASEARRALDAYRELVQAELGVGPSDGVERLVRSAVDVGDGEGRAVARA